MWSYSQIPTICRCIEGNLMDLSSPSIVELRYWMIQDMSWLSVCWISLHRWCWWHWLYIDHGMPVTLVIVLWGEKKTNKKTKSGIYTQSPSLLQISSSFISKSSNKCIFPFCYCRIMLYMKEKKMQTVKVCCNSCNSQLSSILFFFIIFFF